MSVVTHLHQLPDCDFAPDDPVVALTFDDGPGDWTAPIADLLTTMGVPATFFVVGSLAATKPDVVTALAAGGHTVGGHSWSHPRGEVIDDRELVQECERTANVLAELTGRAVRYVRPPYRKVDAGRYASLLDPLGFTTVTWSVDPRDWVAPDPLEIVDGVLGTLHCGAIVLLHDGGRDRSATVEAVPLIVEGARLAGYELVGL